MRKNANEYSFKCLQSTIFLVLLVSGCSLNPVSEVSKPPAAATVDTVTARTPLPMSRARTAATIHPTVNRQTRTNWFVVTGSLRPLQAATITTRNAGRMAEVLVREGDAINARQVVARLDTGELEAQVRSAQAGIAAAKAQIAQAEAMYRQQMVTSQSNIAAAEAALLSAKAQLAQVQAGARSQEKAQAAAQLSIARANLQKAENDLAQYERLAKAGAVAEVEVEQYRTNRDVVAQQVKAQEEAVSLLAEGARQQEIEQAKQAVRQAEETLRQAQAAVTQNDVRRAEIQAAQALLGQRRNDLLLAREAAQDAVIVAPFSGRVVERKIEPGQRVVADEVVFTIASSRVYFEPSIPETELRYLTVGQAVRVAVDAYPGRTFAGRVTRIGAVGQAAGRSFPVRIELPVSRTGELRPGMFARGEIQRTPEQG